jgi:hypothetical protein
LAADLEACPRQVLVKLKAAWQKVFLQWVLDARDRDGKSGDEEEATVAVGDENWLPLPLSSFSVKMLHVPPIIRHPAQPLIANSCSWSF